VHSEDAVPEVRHVLVVLGGRKGFVEAVGIDAEGEDVLQKRFKLRLQ
jgi:hypothetical protein